MGSGCPMMQLKGNKLDFGHAMPPIKASASLRGQHSCSISAYDGIMSKVNQWIFQNRCLYSLLISTLGRCLICFPELWTAPPVQAREQYAQLVHRCEQQIGSDKVKDGMFGAMMEVKLINDGPVTITLDSHARD